MTILATILIYGVPGSLVLSALILAMLWHNPRLLLHVNASVILALPHLLGNAKPIWPARGDVRGQLPLVHRIVA